MAGGCCVTSNMAGRSTITDPKGNNGSIKTFVLGQAGQKTTLTPTALVANTCGYLSHKSEEDRSDLAKNGTSVMFRNVPSIREVDIVKLKRIHPRAEELVTCVQFPKKRTDEMDKFMSMGSEDLSLHDRLYQYYNN